MSPNEPPDPDVPVPAPDLGLLAYEAFHAKNEQGVSVPWSERSEGVKVRWRAAAMAVAVQVSKEVQQNQIQAIQERTKIRNKTQGRSWR